ncbi:1,4-alpha-glucan branching protein GlgB [Paenibacillus sp. GCM10012307]|uniref:1,4-alpha-glucan branching enzyme GlgB n=1 Tax=Paenibacillus roseus TaxID=2798579 RepID=A0A934JCH0_9BACL|nr:1,4-alpha-glucan branching protein GlgB [Paenibacillus roseus]MBJ6364280.1 1,4-alpha-glucan branching protein GlgB [Paenibacillus roseus]
MIDAPLAGLSITDLYLFNEGRLYHSYHAFGAHIMESGGKKGVRFAVWAPQASSVSVVGSFNGWNGRSHLMEPIGTTGVWWTFVADIGEGELYKYEIETASGTRLLKADPFAFYAERRPGTASITASLKHHQWQDEAWMQARQQYSSYNQPLLIYEVHPGSWRIKGTEDFYTYDELAVELVAYAQHMGYTHIELMPLTEHPLDASWGYQATGYFAATSRYGEPAGLMRLVDRCHQAGLGVILDWVPGHFCKDAHGLRDFDGTPLYEGADWRRAEKPLWGTLAFDFGKSEVQSFLISSAIFWMEVFHLDGLRVDAVASMIDLHFDKPESMRTFNEHGGKDNMAALQFLKKLNEAVFHYYPTALMIAEDSSSWPAVTGPSYLGGLGFNFKWNMGWMNDMLRYMALDPAERCHHHQLITFSLMYAFNENFVLPLSHDEVVHGKRSLLNKMSGGYEERFAQLRLFFGYWMTHPGKKLLFMGSEWGQYDEWKDREQLDWMLLDYELHRSLHLYSQALNRFYASEPALWELDCKPEGFEWIDAHNAEQAVIAFIRRAGGSGRFVVVLCNFSERAVEPYRVGVPQGGIYRIIFRSDESDLGPPSDGGYCCKAVKSGCHGREFSVTLQLPPFSFLVLKPEAGSLPQ